MIINSHLCSCCIVSPIRYLTTEKCVFILEIHISQEIIKHMMRIVSQKQPFNEKLPYKINWTFSQANLYKFLMSKISCFYISFVSFSILMMLAGIGSSGLRSQKKKQERFVNFKSIPDYILSTKPSMMHINTCFPQTWIFRLFPVIASYTWSVYL